jgi:hypothetical protein
MSDLYDADILAWSTQQADALRRRASNELDWPNIAEEIEAVGRSETNATLSQLENILRHRLYLLGWPESRSVRKWQTELTEFRRQLRRHYTASMRGAGAVTDAVVADLYVDARAYAEAHIDEPPAVPLPISCPWTLDDTLEA